MPADQQGMMRSTSAAPPLYAFSMRPPVSRVVIYTWEHLLTRTGLSTENEVLVVLGPAKPRKQLLSDGRQHYGQRRHEQVRWTLGTALDFFVRATPTQQNFLSDLTPTVMRATVWSAWQSDTVYTRHRHGTSAAMQVCIPRSAEWDVTLQRAARCRDALRSTLRAWLGELPELASSSVVADDPASIASSFTRMVHLARETLQDPVLSDVTSDSVITEDWLDAQAELITELKLIARATAPVTVSTVSLQDVHYWDAVSVTLLDRLYTAFDAARRDDPTVPFLTYPADGVIEPEVPQAPVNDVDEFEYAFNDNA